MRRCAIVLLVAAIVAGAPAALFGQPEHEATVFPDHVFEPGPVTEGLGAFLGSFATPGGTSPVGIEHDGSGAALWLTEIGNDEIILMNTSGGLISSFSYLPDTDSALGITFDGTDLRVTDSLPDLSETVNQITTAGTFLGSFSVDAQTSFPEGITFNPFTGNLYVVDGDATPPDNVFEYDLAGTLVNTFPLATTSTDGIAFDPERCSYWVYDSGTDTVTHYDIAFNVMESFPGTAAAGFANGEGVAVIGDILYVVSTGSIVVVTFDVADAMVGTGCSLFADGFESGDTSAWSNTVPPKTSFFGSLALLARP